MQTTYVPEFVMKTLMAPKMPTDVNGVAALLCRSDCVG